MARGSGVPDYVCPVHRERTDDPVDIWLRIYGFNLDAASPRLDDTFVLRKQSVPIRDDGGWGREHPAALHRGCRGIEFVIQSSPCSTLGLTGAGVWLLILTKLVMTIQTFAYCQIRFRFFNWWDFLFPTALATASVILFIATRPVIGLHPAVGLTLTFYALVIWRMGRRFLGRLPSRG